MNPRTHVVPEGVRRAEALALNAPRVTFPEAESHATLFPFYRHRVLELMRRWVALELRPFWSREMSQHDADILCESRASHETRRALYRAETRVLQEAVRDVTLLWELEL